MGNHEPTAKSAAERRLERAHTDTDDDADRETLLANIEECEERIEELNEKFLDLELEMARSIAAHPMVSLSPLDVLAACDHDRGEIADLFAELYHGESDEPL